MPPDHTLRPRVPVLAVVAGLCVLALLVTAVAVRCGGTVPVASEQQRRQQEARAPQPPAPGAADCAGHKTEAPRQLRGMTLTTVLNIDFPSRPGLDEQTVKNEYRGWVDLAQRLKHNAIFVHIRPSGDAFWPSQYAPWSDWLTGKRDGVSPGWDPLAFMVAEAHARNLEFHAWFNPYRGSQPAPKGAGADLNQLAPNHPLRAHPEWVVAYPAGAANSRLYFDPGIPEARRFVEDSMLEAVQKYDLDGVFFDDFFYPYPEGGGKEFNDAASFAAHGAGFANRGDWRRDNVNKLVQEMNQRIKAIKPWVKFGISPFGIWRNSATDPSGSATRGLQSFDDIYADSKLWVTKGWLDYIVPQLYWQIGFDKADYAKLLPWWSDVVKGTKVQLYIGQGDYRVGEDGAWKDPGELDRQLALNAKYPTVSGNIHYNATSVRADKLGAVTRYVNAQFPTPALVPVMDHLKAAPPAAPTGIAARRDGAATKVTWQPGQGAAATSFAVYRVDEAAGAGAPATLAATVRRTGDGEQAWVDRAAGSRVYQYCVTGLDRLWNEGAPSAVSATG